MTTVDQRYVVPSWGEYGFAALRVVLFVLFLVALWELLNAMTKFDDEHELFTRKNVPYAVARIAVVLAQATAMMPLVAIDTAATNWAVVAGSSSASFGGTGTGSGWADLGSTAAWSAGVLLVLLALGPVVDRVVGNGASRDDERAGTDLPTSVIKAGFFLAVGFILNAALSGSAPDVGTGIVATVVFIALGLVALLASYQVTGLLGPFRARRSDANGAGLAAAIVRGGALVALGLVLRTAIAGDFLGWGAALLGFAVTAVTGFVGLLLVMWLIDLLIIRSRRLSQIVADDEVLPAVVMSALLVAVALGVSAVAV